jgi:large subunit ribosomal protein L13
LVALFRVHFERVDRERDVINHNKTFLAKVGELQPQWLQIDADGLVVGRLAARIATILMGKHKPTYTPHVDTGDFVIVVNCEKVRFGGRPMAHPTHPYFTSKMLRKQYVHYTGYPGGLKSVTAADLIVRRPEEIIRQAVKRMMPKTNMGRHMLAKLKIYAGPTHPHTAQQPQVVTL